MSKRFMSKNKSGIHHKSEEKFCIRCGCQFTKMFYDNEMMCSNCKVEETVARMTRRV